MLKSVKKWFVKRYVSNAKVKKAIHDMNATFAQKVKIEGKVRVVEVTNDVMGCVKVRLEGFADDGRIDDGELEKINLTDDQVVDKYFSDEKIEEFVDRLFS